MNYPNHNYDERFMSVLECLKVRERCLLTDKPGFDHQ